MSTVNEGYDPNLMGWISSVEQEADEAADNPMMVGSAAIETHELMPEIEALVRGEMASRYGTEEGWDFTIAEERVYGSVLWTQQPNGNCVGSSGAIAVGSRYAHEIYVAGDCEEPFGREVWSRNSGIPFIPYVYGAGRHEGGFTGNGDGSSCQGQLKGLKEWGFLPCWYDQLQQYDAHEQFPQSTASVNKLFGRNKNEIEKHASAGRQYALEDSTVIDDLDHLWEVMVDRKCPVMQASNWGFAASRDTTPWGDPIYKQSGRWSHQMSLRKLIKREGRRWGWIGNQWGQNNHSGQCGFWVVDNVLDSYIRACHAVGLGSLKGEPQLPPAM